MTTRFSHVFPVLTFPFPWRPRLAQDGELLGRLTQIFVDARHFSRAKPRARPVCS